MNYNVAYSSADKPYPSVTFVADAKIELAYQMEPSACLFPIAATNTLPQGFYDSATLDTRYPNDRRRSSVIETVAEQPETGIRFRSLLGSVAMESLEPFESRIPLDRIDQVFSVDTIDEFIDMTVWFLRVPEALRMIAYQDPSSAIEALEIIGNVDGIGHVIDLTELISLIEHELQAFSGSSRMERLKSLLPIISKIVSKQLQAEDSAIADGKKNCVALHEERIVKKRAIVDGIDGTLFRIATNSGVIVDPGYLNDDTYYADLENEAEVTLDHKIGFLRHMMGGHWALGQDHTFVYKNSKPGMAAAQTGVIPDYAAIRPGNFIYHDLKLLEHGPFKEGFPTRILYTYLRHHYLRKMDLTVLDDNRETKPGQTDVELAFEHDGVRFVVPLERTPEHVIPFRALKKNYVDPNYYEYGEECYMAELVDMALQLDLIEAKKGNGKTLTISHTFELGQCAKDLIDDLYYSSSANDHNMTAVAIEQLLFMQKRRAVGGRRAIMMALADVTAPKDWQLRLSTVEIECDEFASTPRKPLSCYFEWFQRYARHVDNAELAERGIPITPSVLSAK